MTETTPELRSARELVRAGRRIVALTGAGISTDSGIPDFRGPQGRWTQNPGAEKVSTLSWYLGDRSVRERAWQFRANSPHGTARPNPGHLALVELERAGRLRGIVTQNTDGLHLQAGTSPDRLCEVHGNARTWRCQDCEATGPMAEQLQKVRDGDPDPRCPACGGITRATVILFEEALDRSVLDAAVRLAGECDLLLALGTTLLVHPVAGLVPYAVGRGAKLVIVNAQETPYDGLAEVVLRDPLSEVLPRLVEGLTQLTEPGSGAEPAAPEPASRGTRP